MLGMSTSPSEVVARREKFISAYAETGDATAAAIAAGFSHKGADRKGSQILGEVEVGARARAMREAKLKEQADDFSRQQKALRFAADGAIETLVDIAKSAPRDVEGKPDKAHHLAAMARVQAAVAILDRAGHKPIERVESTVSWRDATRELEAIDPASMLQNALKEIAESEQSQPEHAGESE